MHGIRAAILLCLCPAAFACAGQGRIVLQSNQTSRFWIDEEEVGQGRILRVSVSDEPHRVVVKAPGYVAKEEFIQPPYDTSAPYRFTFLIEDQERYAAIDPYEPISDDDDGQRPRGPSHLREWLRGRSAVRLAVLELQGDGAIGYLSLISDEIRGAAVAFLPSTVTVITRESMAVVLRDMGRSDVCTEGECEVETARNIGADLVISGEIHRLDGSLQAVLKVHETATGSLLATTRISESSEQGLLDALRANVSDMLR